VTNLGKGAYNGFRRFPHNLKVAQNSGTAGTAEEGNNNKN